MPARERVGFSAYWRRAMQESLAKTKAISNFAKVLCGGLGAAVVFATLLICNPGSDSWAKLWSGCLSLAAALFGVTLYSLGELAYHLLIYPIDEENRLASKSSELKETFEKLESVHAAEREQLLQQLSSARAEQGRRDNERPRLKFIGTPTGRDFGDQCRFEITLKNNSEVAASGVNVQAVSTLPNQVFPNAILPEVLDTYSKSDHGTVTLRSGEACAFRVVSWSEHGHVSLCSARDGLTSAKFENEEAEFEVELKAYGDHNTIPTSTRVRFFWNRKLEKGKKLRAEVVAD